MVKKQSSMKQHFPYLAIVAVVAVVAIVFLILNFTGISSTGEAVRFARTASTAASAPDPCKEGEKCGFVTKDDVQQKLVFIGDLEKVSDKLYGDDDYLAVKSGNEICSDLGYSSCFSAEMLYSDWFYSSKDTSCQNIQVIENFAVPVACDVTGQWTECLTFGWYSPLEEPRAGDHKDVDDLAAVTCIE
ncbi:MAG: hypothetical protein AABW48_02570 [Nanoarchaeota archaeon]